MAQETPPRKPRALEYTPLPARKISKLNMAKIYLKMWLKLTI